jgi:hypothetical protein
MAEASPHCGAVAVAELEVVGLSKSRGQSSPVVEGGHEVVGGRWGQVVDEGGRGGSRSWLEVVVPPPWDRVRPVAC